MKDVDEFNVGLNLIKQARHFCSFTCQFVPCGDKQNSGFDEIKDDFYFVLQRSFLLTLQTSIPCHWDISQVVFS